MAIRYNTVADRPYDDETGRYVSWSRARKSSNFRAELSEYEDFLRVLKEAGERLRKKIEEEEEEAVGYDLIEDIIDSYLDIYEIDPEKINDSP